MCYYIHERNPCKGEYKTMTDQWVSMNKASEILKGEGIKIPVSKISRLASRGTIRAESDPMDIRVKLVELNELRQLIGSSKQYK
jgi:translation elongation factor EF-Ts